MLLSDFRISVDASLNFSTLPNSPYLYFVRSSGLLALHFFAPNNQGHQVFYFDPQIFIDAFNNAKFKRSTPKSDYVDFDTLFFNFNYPKAPPFIRQIFSLFIINPSVIRSVIKSRKRINLLKPCRTSCLNFIHSPRLRSPSSTSPKPVNQQLLDDAIYNMNLAVSKAANSHDLNRFFPFYLQAYKDSLSAQNRSPYLSPKQIDKLISAFSNLVVDYNLSRGL